MVGSKFDFEPHPRWQLFSSDFPRFQAAILKMANREFKLRFSFSIENFDVFGVIKRCFMSIGGTDLCVSAIFDSGDVR